MSTLCALVLAVTETCTIGAHLGTHHATPFINTVTQERYNNVNPGVYIAKSDGGPVVGALHNSYRRLSVYAGWRWEKEYKLGPLSGDVSLLAGGITGYPAASVLPLVVPSARVSALRISILPKPPIQGGTWAIHFSLEKSL